MLYIPINLIFFLAFAVLFGLLIFLIQIGILEYAFESMGINRRYFMVLLLCCLLGSYINVPIARLPGNHSYSGEIVDIFGMRYVVPVLADSPGTVLAVNIGGAVIPFLLSLYLIEKHGLYGRSVAAVAIVSLLVHFLARPVPGVGIAVPMFVPPLFTAIVAVWFSPSNPAPLAYIAGSLGTLIGADLLNLNKLETLGAPVASIGGAGQFDGIFLTGLVAVLLAGVAGRRRRRSRERSSY
jgi:uncharacterized membrane protein